MRHFGTAPLLSDDKMTLVAMEKRILVTDDVHPILLETFSQWGYEVDYEPDITYEATGERIGMYHGLIINSKIHCHRAFLEKAGKLEFIGRLGSGMEIVDIPFARSLGIAVFSAPEGNALSVAEHALGMLLSLMHRIPRADREVKAFEWHREKNRGVELSGKTVGILGFGHTGRAFSQVIKGFGCRILAYDKYLEGAIAAEGVEEVTLPALLAQADIVSLHVSHPGENHHMVNGAFLDQMKPGSILINTSRGKVVHTEALIEALERGHLQGVCLDVFENEKVNTYTADERAMYQRLYSLENTVLTPHVAGWTVESKYRISEVLLEKIKDWISHNAGQQGDHFL